MKNEGVLRRASAIVHREAGRPPYGAGDARSVHALHRARTAWNKLPSLSHFVFEYLLALPAGAAIALLWANTFAESYFRFAHTLAFAVNDILMVSFFALITKEIVEATASGGVLHPLQRALVPALASIGISVVPAVLYLGFINAIDAPMFGRGWSVVLATDLALGYFVMRVLFGRHPAIPFFLVLGIGANGLGFIALALSHRTVDSSVGLPVVLVLAAAAVVGMLRRAKIRSLWPYFIAGGGLSWGALYWGEFHPALALIPIVPFLPHAARDRGFFVDAPPYATDTLSRLELACRHPAQLALFFFGLVNAGVPINGLELATWALPLAALAGKPLGLAAAVAFALAMGLRLPARIGWRDLAVIGFVSGIGFTMALFFATSTMAPGQMLTETKMGALLSLVGAAMAYGAARYLRVGRFAHSATR
jgi:NhaA family Na+:H+ antiporter